MGQINFIRDLIGEKLSLKPNLGLIKKFESLDDQIKSIEFNVFFQNILSYDIL
jgi:hypothetical protein